MQLEFPYQVVTFLDKEPRVNEPVYDGENGWYPQLALKRRFKTKAGDEEGLIHSLKGFFNQLDEIAIETGALVKPERMPVQVVDITNQDELKSLHLRLIRHLEDTIISRYPDREGDNYYAHITAEYNGKFVIPVDRYLNQRIAVRNIWLLKDANDENSLAYIKLR